MFACSFVRINDILIIFFAASTNVEEMEQRSFLINYNKTFYGFGYAYLEILQNMCSEKV